MKAINQNQVINYLLTLFKEEKQFQTSIPEAIEFEEIKKDALRKYSLKEPFYIWRLPACFCTGTIDVMRNKNSVSWIG